MIADGDSVVTAAKSRRADCITGAGRAPRRTCARQLERGRARAAQAGEPVLSVAMGGTVIFMPPCLFCMGNH